jgi:hypothetical protein
VRAPEIKAAIAEHKAAVADEIEEDDETVNEPADEDGDEVPARAATEQPRRRTRLERELDAGAYNRLLDERAHNEDLAEKLRAAEIRITGLESEVGELKAERDQLRSRITELEAAKQDEPTLPKRGRGRPPGSPNKPKPPATPITTGNDPGPMPEFLRRAS